MTTPEKLKVDQVVHGYRDGHRQLAGSLVLDVEAADLMALASDLLTSRSLGADESYITGYALKSDHKYVFARTWAAPEMSRPGCVWTHSLVIDYLTVSKIDDPDLILSLFERPTLATLLNYGIALTLGDSPAVDVPIISGECANEVVQRIYGRRWPHSEVILSSRGAEKDTYTAFAVWTQLPPRLRRATVFCTAASASGLPVESDLTIKFSLEPVSSISSSDQEGWGAPSMYRGMRLLAKDLTHRLTTPLRQFLRRYSIDVIEPLPSMGILAQVFLLLREAHQREDFKGVAVMVGRAFSKSQDAQLLKQDLLLGRFFVSSTMTDRRANSLLGTLDAIHEDCLAILPDSELAKEITGVGEGSPYLLVSLFELHASPCTREFVDSCIRSIANQMPLAALAPLEVKEQQALSLIAMRPELLREEAFWLLHAASRTEILRAGVMDAASIACFFRVCQDDLQPSDIEVLLERESEITVTCIAALWKEEVVSERDSRMLVQVLGRRGDLLSRAITSAGRLPRAAWQDVGGVLASGAHVSISSAVWARVVKRAKVAVLSRHESTLGAHLFVIGLESPPVTARVLLGVSFDLLYVTARNGNLTIPEQNILDKRLPGAETYWAWDYCRRLTEALLECLLKSDSIEALLRMEVSSPTVNGIVGQLRRRDDGLTLLGNLNQKLDAVPEARDKWNKAIKDAISHQTVFRIFPW